MIALGMVAALLAQGGPEGMFGYRMQADGDFTREVEIVCQRRTCSGEADGKPFDLTREGNSIEFSLESGESFFGEIRRRRIEGFWVQPANELGMQALASPLVLERTGRGVFAGSPQPLEREFRLVAGFGERDGEKIAVLRNPEFNATGASIQYKVEDDALAVERGGQRREIPYSYDVEADEVVLDFPRLGEIRLARADPSLVDVFLPRMGGFKGLSAVSSGDEWVAASPEAAGFDVGALEDMVRMLAEQDPLAGRPDLLHSVLVAKGGKLVLEEYFYGHDAETRHNLRSAGKTFSSVLLGAAIRDGAKLSEETAVMPLLRETIEGIPEGDGRDAMTFADLMTHRSGLACDDNDNESPGTEWRLWEEGDDNLWAQTARLPMVREPGQIYAYCSGGINLVGGAVSAATGESAMAMIHRLIAEPLGFERYYWNLMPSGDAYLGGGAEVIPRDFLKLGQMALDGGVWNGERLVSEAWMELSTKPWVELTPETTGLSEEDFGNMYFGGTDGLAWHMFDIDVGGRPYRSYEAGGNGGQVVVVVPELELVVAFNGGNYGQGYIWGRWRDRFVGGHIIPALTEKD